MTYCHSDKTYGCMPEPLEQLIAEDTWRHNSALRATDDPTDSIRHISSYAMCIFNL